MKQTDHLVRTLLVAGSMLASTDTLAADEAAKPAAYAPDFVPTRADRVILLDVEQAGARIHAVGERGVVLQSDDGGSNWKGRRTPTTRTLTGIVFNDEKHGVAVGHGATILRTEDGGATWQAVVVEDAGIDSLLGAVALGGTRVIAYGAFGLYLESNDNGRGWTRHQVIDAEFDRHISQVIEAGDGLLLIGETGTLATSADGVNYTRVVSPYEGSFFGGLATPAGAWLIYGMRGNVFRSEDRGATWTKVEVGSQKTVSSGRVLSDGRIVLVGIAGNVLVSGDDGRSFAKLDAGLRQSLAQVVELAGGGLLVVGDAGVAKVAQPGTGTATAR